jgi:3-oxoadipate enol-lactonase
MYHEMAAMLGQAPVSVVPDAGHLSNIENADAFNHLALDWLVSRSDLASVPTQWPQGV